MDNPVLWGRSIRIIHWMVAGGVLVNWFVLEEGDPPHRWIGYVVATLVVCRIGLGIIGRGAMAFRSWPLHWSDLKSFLECHFSRIDHDYRTHNPLASYVYLVIWSVILALGLSGWMMGLDAFWGEDWLKDIHGALAKGLMFLIVLHFGGIMVDSYLFKRKTWMGMITGKSK